MGTVKLCRTLILFCCLAVLANAECFHTTKDWCGVDFQDCESCTVSKCHWKEDLGHGHSRIIRKKEKCPNQDRRQTEQIKEPLLSPKLQNKPKSDGDVAAKKKDLKAYTLKYDENKNEWQEKIVNVDWKNKVKVEEHWKEMKRDLDYQFTLYDTTKLEVEADQSKKGAEKFDENFFAAADNVVDCVVPVSDKKPVMEEKKVKVKDEDEEETTRTVLHDAVAVDFDDDDDKEFEDDEYTGRLAVKFGGGDAIKKGRFDKNKNRVAEDFHIQVIAVCEYTV